MKPVFLFFATTLAIYAQAQSRVAVNKVDVYNLPCYTINGQSGDELIALAGQAIEKRALLVFLFHGVGGEASLNVSLEAQRHLLRYLKRNEKELWITTALEAAEYVIQIKNRK